ncbi:MAG: hypothetical protein P8O06_02430 [Porticoccaceae bacterium]|nr:hypothetical protein [Porticoccaceae bacterium]
MSDKFDIDQLFNQLRDSEPALDDSFFVNTVASKLKNNNNVEFLTKENLSTLVAGAIGYGVAIGYFPAMELIEFTQSIAQIPTTFTLTPTYLISILGISSTFAGLTYWVSEKEWSS